MDVLVHYGFQIRGTGELARLSESRYSDGYSLSDGPGDPVFAVDSVEALVEVLLGDTPSYNSDSTRPGWGPFDREDLVPVRVEVTTSVEEVAVRMPLDFQCVESRDVPRAIAARRVPQALPQNEAFVQVFAFLPEGVARADVEASIGEVVHFGSRYNRRRLLGVGDVPEEYQPEFEGREGVTLVCVDAY